MSPIAAVLAAAAGFCATSVVFAHHSFAPHFDSSKPVRITGTVTELEARNPHAYVHIAAMDENGRTREYVCESHGITQLERNGISRAMLAPGERITLSGSRARRDPYMCFFDIVELADGRLLDVNGSPGPGRPPAAGAVAREGGVPARKDIYGTWLLVPSDRSTSGPQPMMEFLTPAGRAAVEAYDPFVDDPTFRCDPVAIRRVWFAPGTPLEIARDGDDVILRFEWMDVERVVHVGMTDHPADGARTTLGHSIGRFEGDTLIVETANYSEGVLNQYVAQPGEPIKGLLHSDALRTVERIRFDSDSQRLVVSIDHEDPKFFTRPFDTVTAEYAPSALEIRPFNCRPENPDHTLR